MLRKKTTFYDPKDIRLWDMIDEDTQKWFKKINKFLKENDILKAKQIA
jgi:hypothetical protein